MVNGPHFAALQGTYDARAERLCSRPLLSAGEKPSSWWALLLGAPPTA
jgi:hypothetical protein